MIVMSTLASLKLIELGVVIMPVIPAARKLRQEDL
jgi:hypothetical protein